MVRTYNISPDDKTLILHNVIKDNPGENYETTRRYARLSSGHSIFGEWQSVALEEKRFGGDLMLIIGLFDTGRLSFSLPAHKHLSAMKFDGKMYADSGLGDTKGHSCVSTTMSLKSTLKPMASQRKAKN